MSTGSGKVNRSKANTGTRSHGSTPMRFGYGESIVQRIVDAQEETREKARAARKARKKVTLPQFNLPPMEDDSE